MAAGPGFLYGLLSDFKSFGEQMLPQVSGISFVQTPPRCVPMLDLMPSTTSFACPECPPHPSALIQTLHLASSHLLVLFLSTPAPWLDLVHLGVSVWADFHELPVGVECELGSILSTRAYLPLLCTHGYSVVAQQILTTTKNISVQINL